MNDIDRLYLVLLWATAAVAASWLAPPRRQALLVVGCGVGLLGMLSPTALALLSAGTLGTFLATRQGRIGKLALLAGIAVIAAVYFACVLRGRHSGVGVHQNYVLPLGLAFFSLRLIHYLFESFKGSLRTHQLAEYACYQFLPSVLPAGPIHRFDEFLRDWRRRRWHTPAFALGAQRVLYGLAKVIVVGGILAGSKVNAVAGPIIHRGGMAGTYVATLLFWLTLYVEFSGYSDIAIGFALMMGIEVRENFNRPFVARNIAEFWKRWHFSLSSWCRDYVFVPVMAVTRRQWVAVIASMVVLGLWHDLSLRYILWGTYHGAGIAVFRRFEAGMGARIAALPPVPGMAWRSFATLLTLHFVLFSFPITSLLQRLMTRS